MVYVFVACLTYFLFSIKNKGQKICFETFKNKKFINKSSGQLVSIIAVFLLILFASLRAPSVGYDTPNYFENIKRMLEYKAMRGYTYELFFQIINYIPTLIFKNLYAFNAMLFICYTIILLCVCYASKNMSKDISLTMLLFVCVDVYLRTFGQLRQGIAIALIMVASVFAKEKRFFSFSAIIIIAMNFHKSAIIFFPVYFLSLFDKFKFKYWHYIFISIGAVFFCMFDNQIIKFVCDVLGLGYYNTYIKSGLGLQDFTIVGIIEFISIVCIFMFFLIYKILYNKKNNVNIDTDYTFYLNILFLAIIMFFISFALRRPALFGRLVYYYFWVLMFLVPSFLSTLSNSKHKRIFKICMMGVAFAYLGFGIFMNDAYGIKNYVTVFGTKL